MNLKSNKNFEDKLVIYTAIINNYDDINTLFDPKIIKEFKKEGIDFVLFTNDKSYTSSNFKVRYTDLKYSDPYRTAREIKIRPDLFLPEYTISIWIDSNFKFIKTENFKSFVLGCLSKNNICIKKHPIRNCIYDEEKMIIRYKKDNSNVTSKQMNKYKEENFPKNFGLFETGVIFRRHKSTDCILFGEKWCKEVLYYSHRDQLSCNYVTWKYSINVEKILNKDIDKFLEKMVFHRIKTLKTISKLCNIRGFLNNIDITEWLKNRTSSNNNKFLYINESVEEILNELQLEEDDKKVDDKITFVISGEIDYYKFSPKIFTFDNKEQVKILIDNKIKILESDHFNFINNLSENSLLSQKNIIYYANYQLGDFKIRVEDELKKIFNNQNYLLTINGLSKSKISNLLGEDGNKEGDKTLNLVLKNGLEILFKEENNKINMINMNNFKEIAKNVVYKSDRKEINVDEIFLKNWATLGEDELISTLKKLNVKEYLNDIDKGFAKELVITYNTGKIIKCKEYNNKFVDIKKETLKVGIVITTHGDAWQQCKECLESFLTVLNNYNKYIIVFDNESTDNFWTQNIPTFYPNVDYSRSNNQTLTGGLTGTWNRGIKKCIENGCSIVILSNNDVIVNPSILNFFSSIMSDNKDQLLLYGPMSNNPGPKGTNLYQKSKAKDYLEFIKLSSEGTKVLPKGENINGFFMGFHVNTLEKNKFDENNYFDPSKPFGGNEIEWEERFEKKGGVSKVVTNCFVYHSKESSWKALDPKKYKNFKKKTINLKEKSSKREKTTKDILLAELEVMQNDIENENKY